MSLYRQGAGGEPPAGVVPASPINIEGTMFVPQIQLGPPAESGFWTLVKWVGAGLTLWVGYEKIRELYDQRLKGEEPEGAEEE